MPIHKTHLIKYKTIDAKYNNCIKFIDQHCNEEFYIGVTHNPKQRLKEHEDKKNMHNMYLLCEKLKENEAKYIEQKIIKYYEKNKKCENNKQSGGNGIIEELNYIYLLLK